VYGFFTNNNTFEAKNFTMPTYSINVLHTNANFLFKYNEDEELHYKMKNNNNGMAFGGNFLTIYNDGPTVGGEFVTLDNFIHIFYTNSMQVEQVGGHYSLQCLEKEFDPTSNKQPSNCKIGHIEVWAPDRNLVKRKIKTAEGDNHEI